MTLAELETVYLDENDERLLAERATVIETDGAVAEESDGSSIDEAVPSGPENAFVGVSD